VSETRKVAVSAQDSDFLFEPVPLDKFQTLTAEQLIQYIHGQQDLINQLTRINARLKKRAEELEDRSVLLGDQFIVLKHQLYGKSSEKMAAPETGVGEDLDPAAPAAAALAPAEPASKKPPRKRVRLPSERYPNAPLIERTSSYRPTLSESA
jgi:hypothetical protein